MKKRILCAGSALLLGASVMAQSDLRQGLVAYLPFDTVNDDLTTPELVNSNDFQVVNMDASSLVPGHKGSALNFDGLSQYAVRYHDLTAPNTGLPITRARNFTISYWIKGTGAGQGDRRLFAEGSTSTTTPLYDIGTDSAGVTNSADIFIRTDGNVNPVNHRKSVAQPLDGNWHQITLVDANGAVSLYIDGAPDLSFTYARGVITANVTTIGALVRTTVSSFFSGAIDEVAIWERALTASDAQALFQNGIATPIPALKAAFDVQPVSTNRAQGDRVSFTVNYNGTRPFSGQWLKNGAPIDGQTTNTLTLFNVQPGDAADYQFRVTNPAGDSLSDAAHLTVNADPTNDVRRGLVSYWPLNIGQTNTPDLYSANNMTFVNMDASNFVPGQFGNALSFNGTTQYAFRSGGASIYLNTNYSVAFWVKGNYAGQSDKRVFSEGSTASNNPLFNLGTDNTGATPSLNVFIRNDANTAIVNARKSTTPVFDDVWHHVVWVDRNGAAQLYIDGVPDNTDFTYTRSALTVNQTSIGAILRAGASSWFAGAMDEVAVWNRALTFSEVQEVKGSGVPAPVGLIAPTFNTQPQSADVYQGSRVVLSAEATGTSPLTFQWFKGTQQLTGETNKFLNLSNLQPGDSGNYIVRVSNAVGFISSLPATINVTPVAGLNTALVAYWPFETVGATTPDVVNHNDLALVNMDSSNQTDGHAGKALTFNGVDEYLVRTNTGSTGLPISANRAFTISMWVNAIGTGQSDRRPFAEGSTTNNNPLFDIGTASDGSNGNVDMFVRYLDGSNPLNHVRSTIPAFDGLWHHLVWVDDNGNVSLYIDGALDPANFNYTHGVMTADVTAIGAIVRAAVGSYFAGSIDEVALWSRALTENEVLQVQASGPQGSSIQVSTISLAGARLQIAVNTTQDPANLKVQSIDTVDAANWTDVPNVTWTTSNGQAIAEFDRPAVNQRYYRIVGAGTSATTRVLFSDNFEGAAQAWTHGGIGDSWQSGAPTVGPGVAYSGHKVWAVALNGTYANDTQQYLRSPVIDLTGVTSARLSFYEFRDMETGDLADVNIKDASDPDNGFIAQLETSTGGRTAWTRRSLVLPPEALGRPIVIEFNFTSDSVNALPRSGWFIDDVTLSGN